MAEALAVLGIIANIVQLIDFGSKVAHRLKGFKPVEADLQILLDSLEQAKVAVKEGSIRAEEKHALVPVINDCRKQIELLNDVIERTSPLPGDSWITKTGKGIFRLRQDAKVVKIRAILHGHIQTLTYYQAAVSSTRQEAKGIAIHLQT
jgi:hypothetical protein